MKITANNTNKDKKSVQILIEGDLVLSKCGNAKNIFLELLSKHNTFEVKLQNVEAIDIAFVQILVSFLDSIKNEKKQVHVEKTLSAEIENILQSTGVIKFIEKYIEL